MGAATLLGTLQDLAPMGTGKMDSLPAGELFFFFRVAGFPIAVEQFGITDVLVRQFAEMTPGKKIRMSARYVHGGHSRIIHGPDCWGPDCWGFVEPGGVLPPEGAVEPGAVLPPEDGVEPGEVEPGAVLPPEDGVEPEDGAGGGVQPCGHGSK